MEPKKILIVEDAPATRDHLAQLVEIMGFQTHVLQRKTDLLDNVCHQNPDLLLLGSCNDTEEVKDFVKIVRENKNGIPVLVIRDGGNTARLREILEAKCVKANLEEEVGNGTNLDEDQKQGLLKLLKTFEHLFDGTLGKWKSDPYDIQLKEGAQPFHAKAFPIPKVHEQTLRDEVE